MSTREPAEATRPARVSSSGSPAATSAPKARTRMARVTGQETISDFSIASRLASLKSDHSSEEPVGFTSMPSPERSCSGPLRSVATRTISLVSAPAPARTMAVEPSWLRVAPGWGATTSAMRGSASSWAVDRGQHLGARPSVTGPSSLWTTTWMADEALPPKCSGPARERRRTPSRWPASPHPTGSCSTLGAKTPSPTTTSSHADGDQAGVGGDPGAESAEEAGAGRDAVEVRAEVLVSWSWVLRDA